MLQLSLAFTSPTRLPSHVSCVPGPQVHALHTYDAHRRLVHFTTTQHTMTLELETAIPRHTCCHGWAAAAVL